jgi:hypothetical protein
MKVCVIGNSHVAPLMRAMRSKPALGEHRFDFYSVPGASQPRLALRDDRLFPVQAPERVQTTIACAALDGLQVRQFDALVISACGWFAARNENVKADPHAHPLGSVACVRWVEDLAGRTAPRKQIVSSAVFDALVESYVRSHASIELCLLLRGFFPGPILLQPWPAPSRTLKDDAAWFVNLEYGVHAPRAWHDFFRSQRSALEAAAKELGRGFALLEYPFAEVEQDGFMSVDYCDRSDPFHANES